MVQKEEYRFLVDFMLGRLARWLRIFSYDTVYANEQNRATLLLQSLQENRVIITRDHRLSQKRAWKLILIKSDHLGEQLQQLVEETNISISRERLFTRCTICNVSTEKLLNKKEIMDSVPEYVYQTQGEFSRCPQCGRIYWPGTHWELLLRDLGKAGIKVSEK